MTLLARRLAVTALLAAAMTACGGGDQSGESVTDNQQNQVPSPSAAP